MNDTLGIPNSFLAKKIGLVSGSAGYKRLRLRKATEDKHYPELLPAMDQESVQESREAEPPLVKKKLPRGQEPTVKKPVPAKPEKK
jgi:hypothetical protein